MAAVTAASTLSRDAPSHFAALLRRSKFASYDQQIAQVYTTYGGWSHRGDWGLKRPLPQKVRSRRPLISITAVDSIYQQTEWSRSGTSARFLDRWNEMGMDQVSSEGTVRYAGLMASSLATAGRLIDSEFARVPDADDFAPPESRIKIAKSKKQGPRDAQEIPVLNVDKMSPRQFERYLSKLRALRPKFRAFLQARADAELEAKLPQKAEVGLFESSGSSYKRSAELDFAKLSLDPWYESAPDDFIAREVSLSAGRGAWIEQRPHPNGGLTYAHTSLLQSYLFFPPVVGRLVDIQGRGVNVENIPTGGTFVGAAAGITGIVDGISSETQRIMDYGPYSRADDAPDKWHRRDPYVGIVPVRITSAYLARSPRVVGERPENIVDGARFEQIRMEAWSKHQARNDHTPGTRAWVVANTRNEDLLVPNKPVALTTQLLLEEHKVQHTKKHHTRVIGMLTNMLPQGGVSDGQDES